MFEMMTIKGSTNSVSQGLFGKRSIRFNNPALPVRPLGFNRVEPRAFDGQITNQDANTFSSPFDGTVMFSNPATHSLAGVPTGIVPNHGQNRLAQCLDFLAAPLQKLNGNTAHRASIHKTQKHFFKSQIVACHPSQKDAIASQGLWIRIIFLFGLLYQSQRLSFFTPTRQVWLAIAAPCRYDRPRRSNVLPGSLCRPTPTRPYGCVRQRRL